MGNSNNTKVITPHGTDLVSRRAAAILRTHAIQILDSGCRVAFDMANVECISSAYADELFGIMANQVGFASIVKSVKVRDAKPCVLKAVAEAVKARACHRRIPGDGERQAAWRIEKLAWLGMIDKQQKNKPLTEVRDKNCFYVGYRTALPCEIQRLRWSLSKHIIGGLTIYCRNFQTAERIAQELEFNAQNKWISLKLNNKKFKIILCKYIFIDNIKKNVSLTSYKSIFP